MCSSTRLMGVGIKKQPAYIIWILKECMKILNYNSESLRMSIKGEKCMVLDSRLRYDMHTNLPRYWEWLQEAYHIKVKGKTNSVKSSYFDKEKTPRSGQHTKPSNTSDLSSVVQRNVPSGTYRHVSECSCEKTRNLPLFAKLWKSIDDTDNLLQNTLLNLKGVYWSWYT